jgi:hypothetical protein
MAIRFLSFSLLQPVHSLDKEPHSDRADQGAEQNRPCDYQEWFRVASLAKHLIGLGDRAD